MGETRQSTLDRKVTDSQMDDFMRNLPHQTPNLITPCSWDFCFAEPYFSRVIPHPLILTATHTFHIPSVPCRIPKHFCFLARLASWDSHLQKPCRHKAKANQRKQQSRRLPVALLLFLLTASPSRGIRYGPLQPVTDRWRFDPVTCY
jgi:hypothetical protein